MKCTAVLSPVRQDLSHLCYSPHMRSILDPDYAKRRQTPEARRAELEEEVAPYLHLTMDERGDLLVKLCRAGWELLKARPDFLEATRWQDPLPKSSVRLLARLREANRP